MSFALTPVDMNLILNFNYFIFPIIVVFNIILCQETYVPCLRRKPTYKQYLEAELRTLGEFEFQKYLCFQILTCIRLTCSGHVRLETSAEAPDWSPLLQRLLCPNSL